MKIEVELVTVRQEWDPDTGDHQNTVVFEFGGVQVEIPASPEQVGEIIRKAKAQASRVPTPEPAQPVYEEPTEIEFGGTTYVEEERHVATSVPAPTKAELLRERARKPIRRGPDDDGFPQG